jgi:WhiB family redox-sensing transcriptional regulator
MSLTLEQLINRPAWIAQAECRGMDVSLFFPERGERLDAVRDVCRRCEVQAECLAYAINNGEKTGVWGGRSERARRTIRRRAFGGAA